MLISNPHALLFFNNQTEIDFKCNIIKNRLKDFGYMMDPERYFDFLKHWSIFSDSLMTDDQSLKTMDEFIEKAMNIVNRVFCNYSLNKLEGLYVASMEPTNVEINILIVRHLFVFARMLLKKFFVFHSSMNYYDDIKRNSNYYDHVLLQMWNLKIQSNPEIVQQTPNSLPMITVMNYVKFYDELEVKANNWVNILKQISILHRENDVFYYVGDAVYPGNGLPGKMYRIGQNHFIHLLIVNKKV
uniref:DDE Tnp4 domain-containing protein n=1 Tax=Meloidogyne hapla TaxID=6305 RepID=A0A1I8BM22_MELHA